MSDETKQQIANRNSKKSNLKINVQTDQTSRTERQADEMRHRIEVPVMHKNESAKNSGHIRQAIPIEQRKCDISATSVQQALGNDRAELMFL